jgi:hypothetical protein
VTRRPFRAPHHTTSHAGLVGGGQRAVRPGEITLAQASVQADYWNRARLPSRAQLCPSLAIAPPDRPTGGLAALGASAALLAAVALLDVIVADRLALTRSELGLGPAPARAA